MDLITLYETFTQRRETPAVPQESMLFLCSVTNAPCVRLTPTNCVFMLLVYQVYGPWTTVEQERTLTTSFTKSGGSMAMVEPCEKSLSRKKRGTHW